MTQTISVKPLLIVHRIRVDRAFTAECGALAGSRTWDAGRGRWLQHTARYSLPPSPVGEDVICGDCRAGVS